MKVVVNAANLHAGGGVQVAASFIEELAGLILGRQIDSNLKISVIYSNTVRESISDMSVFNHFESSLCYDIFGLKKPGREFFDFISNSEAVFTVFGPVYYKLPTQKHVCGFAQPWIAYPHNSAYSKLSLIDKLKTKLKFELQWMFFKNSDHLVVEQEHVKNALISNRGFSDNLISVVENCVSSQYIDSDEREYSCVDISSKVRLGVMGRAYMHKNIDILPEVANILKEKYLLDVEFIFTLTTQEMNLNGFERLSGFSTVGSLNVTECLTFYRGLDGIVFPSLLECYSATPVEAMAMKLPVFVSDRAFVKNVCKEFAFYFDPLDPQSIAKVIFEGLSNSNLLKYNVDNAYLHVRSLPTAKDRAEQYVKLLTN
ncbi:glycosyltransferase [Photobacterium kagoshimensis]|uniref:glycosyltransferase n=1 Tax=Photobacterium kagoshimensis TaxID=2910242 RepID=UPI003D0F9B69